MRTAWKKGFMRKRNEDNQAPVHQEPLFSIVLVEPKIPPNTGNIARMTAALQVPLYLVGNLGFDLGDRQVKRAGLDYWAYADVRVHPDIRDFFSGLLPEKLHFFSKHASRNYTESCYRHGDYLVFGSEITGLPGWMFETYADRFVSLPIYRKEVRSLNLSSAAAAGAYEALRQINLVRNAC